MGVGVGVGSGVGVGVGLGVGAGVVVIELTVAPVVRGRGRVVGAAGGGTGVAGPVGAMTAGAELVRAGGRGTAAPAARWPNPGPSPPTAAR